jgi:putative endonuclease
MHGLEKRIVYIIRSDAEPKRHYVGITDNIDARLEWHNRGPSGYTVNYRPWSLVVTIQFRTEEDARGFERYLKSGSGRAFARRHFAAADPDAQELNSGDSPGGPSR